jgi:hypothetical protein
MVVLLFVIAIIGYFILITLIKNETYREIAKEFRKESKGSKIRNLILCVLYFVSTFVVAFGWPNWFPSK